MRSAFLAFDTGARSERRLRSEEGLAARLWRFCSASSTLVSGMLALSVLHVGWNNSWHIESRFAYVLLCAGLFAGPQGRSARSPEIAGPPSVACNSVLRPVLRPRAHGSGTVSFAQVLIQSLMDIERRNSRECGGELGLICPHLPLSCTAKEIVITLVQQKNKNTKEAIVAISICGENLDEPDFCWISRSSQKYPSALT